MRQFLPFLSVFFLTACSGLEKFDIGDTGTFGTNSFDLDADADADADGGTSGEADSDADDDADSDADSDGSPGDGSPGDGSPGDGSPGDGSPGDGSPGDGSPGDGPGETCGDGMVYDCSMACVSRSSATAYVGDGYCDDGSSGMDLMCEEFGFDGGDCAGGSGADADSDGTMPDEGSSGGGSSDGGGSSSGGGGSSSGGAPGDDCGTEMIYD